MPFSQAAALQAGWCPAGSRLLHAVQAGWWHAIQSAVSLLDAPALAALGVLHACCQHGDVVHPAACLMAGCCHAASFVAPMLTLAGFHLLQDLHDDRVFGFNLGLDGASLYRHKQHGTWMYFLQCADLPEEYRFQTRFTMPLAIIPGPEYPQQGMFNGVNRLIASEFKAGLKGASMQMAGRDERVTCYWLLLCIIGDTPALRHVTLHQSCSGYRGCTHCKGALPAGCTTLPLQVT